MKKVKVKEIPSKIKEIKKAPVSKATSLEDDLEHPTMVAQEATHSHVPVLNAPRVVRIEDTPAGEVIQRELPQQSTQPLYEGRRAYGPAPAPSSQPERVYEDPMVASARRSGVVEKPTGVLRREFIHPQEDSSGVASNGRNASDPFRQDKELTREETYTVDQQRAKSQQKRRYPWEA